MQTSQSLQTQILDPNRTIEDAWRQITRVIKRFPDLREIKSMEEFADKVEDGSLQAFPVGKDSIIVGCTYEDGTVKLVAAAGDMDDLLIGLTEFENFYKERGYRMIVIYGRVGWRRVLKDRGYQFGDYEDALVKEL